MSGPLFTLRDVTLPGSHTPRLKFVTLAIPVGATAVVGLSGAGKTSLLNVLAGFETAFSGDLKMLVSSDKKDRLPVYWVPQNGGLWPHLSVEQHLDVVNAEVPQNSNSRTESGRFSKRTDELLSLFDLNHRRQALPAELSQGERSRLALARALATRANVLLLDEPLSHVDPVRKPAYWKIVRQVVAEENVSMVFTSHEPETVLRHAENVICLEAGAVAFEGSVRTLYDNPPNRQVGEFLGPLNWFARDEVATFLVDQAGDADVAIRPERLLIELLADSPIEFELQLFAGLYSESIVRHTASGATMSVLHQSQISQTMKHGDRVTLRMRPHAGANS